MYHVSAICVSDIINVCLQVFTKLCPTPSYSDLWRQYWAHRDVFDDVRNVIELSRGDIIWLKRHEFLFGTVGLKLGEPHSVSCIPSSITKY